MTPMRLKDTATSYGWISIAFHWITAIVIIALLFIGNSIATFEASARAEALALHTSIGISSYLLLWVRIIWRFVYGHPGPLSGQKGAFFTIGKWVHYIVLVALGLMLVTGPLMAWSDNTAIQVWDWFAIPAPFQTGFAFRDLMHSVHRMSAIVIFVGILLHLGGVYKHTAFNQDGTFVKIIVPGKAVSAEVSEGAAER